jgi:hypothetical protein
MRSTVHVDILVPLSDNDGRPFPHAVFHAFEIFLANLASGFTRHGDVDGAWRSPMSGELMRDRSRSYSITLDAEIALAQIPQIDSYIRRFFRQEAAFLELIPTRASMF